MKFPWSSGKFIFGSRLLDTGNNSKTSRRNIRKQPLKLIHNFPTSFFKTDLFFWSIFKWKNTSQPIFHTCESKSKSSINFPNIKSNYKPNFPFNIISEFLNKAWKKKGVEMRENVEKFFCESLWWILESLLWIFKAFKISQNPLILHKFHKFFNSQAILIYSFSDCSWNDVLILVCFESNWCDKTIISLFSICSIMFFPSRICPHVFNNEGKQTKPHYICEKVHWVCKISAITNGRVWGDSKRMKVWNVLKAFSDDDCWIKSVKKAFLWKMGIFRF